MLSFNDTSLRDFEFASSREWLETNGIGGYASGTIAGANSRRYHGLLVAATEPPLGRMVLLSKFEEAVTIDGETVELSSNRYPGSIHPKGYDLRSFRLDPFPVWTYVVNGVEIERCVFMVAGENTTVCQWHITKRPKGSAAPILQLRPLIAFRDHHHLRHEDANFNGDFEAEDNVVTIRPVSEAPSLYFLHNANSTEPSGYWYKNFDYAIEEERGFDHLEDLFQPFVLNFSLSTQANVIVSTARRDIGEAEEFRAKEMRRRRKVDRRGKC